MLIFIDTCIFISECYSYSEQAKLVSDVALWVHDLDFILLILEAMLTSCTILLCKNNDLACSKPRCIG